MEAGEMHWYGATRPNRAVAQELYSPDVALPQQRIFA
jgi:hypothetical protein